MRFIRSGKVKDIYEWDDAHLLFHFTDRVSAFDRIIPSMIPRKGEALCRLSAYWFDTLGVPHHMVRLDGKDRMIVRRLQMIPVECIVRGYLYGSLYERVKNAQVRVPIAPILAAKLHEPLFDPTTKSEEKDVPVTEGEILARKWLNESELLWLREQSLTIYRKIAAAAEYAGFILADLKLEYGWSEDGQILLGDSIGPDEFRLWPCSSYAPGKIQEAYDKQPIRDWLIAAGYKERLDQAFRSGLPLPSPPSLPEELISETSHRYATAYEKLTNLAFA